MSAEYRLEFASVAQEYLDACIRLLNDEWPRSESARRWFMDKSSTDVRLYPLNIWLSDTDHATTTKCIACQW
jgi:hypothetical protein